MYELSDAGIPEDKLEEHLEEQLKREQEAAAELRARFSSLQMEFDLKQVIYAVNRREGNESLRDRFSPFLFPLNPLGGNIVPASRTCWSRVAGF